MHATRHKPFTFRSLDQPATSPNLKGQNSRSYHAGCLCGRGPALFGCFFVLAIPVALLAVLIDQLYPGGFWTFAWKVMVTIPKGFHL